MGFGVWGVGCGGWGAAPLPGFDAGQVEAPPLPQFPALHPPPAMRALEHEMPAVDRAYLWYGQFKNSHLTKMCSGSEAGAYLRRIA